MNVNVVGKGRRMRQGRRLVLVDVENVVGGAVEDRAFAAAARECIAAGLGVRDDEQVIIGTSHIGMLSVGIEWPAARLVVRSGPDGADLALLDVLVNERIADRFSEVLLVSGDGIFTDAVSALGAAGVNVTVAARIGSCAKRLRMAARQTITYTFDTDITMEGAA